MDEEIASYSWSLVSANESFTGSADVSPGGGRDPRNLVIPPYTLGYAGSFYQFQLKATFGSDLTSTVNATGEFREHEAVGSTRYVQDPRRGIVSLKGTGVGKTGKYKV